MSELRERGYEESKIEQIKEYKNVFTEHLNNLNELPDENLSNLGYSSEQIAVLRNFNGSEDDLQLLSASGTMEVSINNVKYWP